jgi:SpoVK/Ycf46/Vps4 family AAA+-type ATPase
LLYGPPGTGKTQIARTLSKESGVAFIAAGPADLKAGFLGQSVQKVNELFQRARDKAPCILFIDEIDSGAPDRSGANADQYTIEIVNELLRQMDGVRKSDRHVFVLAATNLPGLVDPALLSRFEEKIEIANRSRGGSSYSCCFCKQTVDFDVEEMAVICHSGAVDRRT